MTDFDFLMSLYGLLLGFSLIEVLGGLAKVIEAQLRAVNVGAEARGAAPFRAGWLTPLLGLFVMLDVVSFWGSAWVARNQIVYDGPVILGGLFFAGSYYITAHLIFPTEKADWADLDAHYFRVRRTVFGVLMVLTTIQTAYLLTVPRVSDAIQSPIVLASAFMLYTLLTVGMVVRGKRASIVVLALLSLRYAVQYLS